MNDRVRYESEEYELQFVTSSVTWPSPHWQVNTAKNLEKLVKVSESLVNGAFGAIGANGDNKWRQWMLHCRQWRFGE